MPEDISELVDLIADIKAGQTDGRGIDQQLDIIEIYAEKFSQWFESDGERITAVANAGEEQPEIDQLLADHTAISDYARQLLEKTSLEQRDARRKGKGVLAYLDILPKRLSVTRARKG